MTTDGPANRYLQIIRRILPLLAFIVPFVILYQLDPSSFEATWEGRTFYLFFAWLISLEIILGWEKLAENPLKLKSVRTVFLILALALPTVYIVAANFYGLNAQIVSYAKSVQIPPEIGVLLPLSTEYLIFTVFFVLIVYLDIGITRLHEFSISAFFLGAIGIIYTINNLYPYDKFTPFQILVPSTATFSANFLNMIGYHAEFLRSPSVNMPRLLVTGPSGGFPAVFDIAWPCSGIESLIIYTVTILLFLKKSSIPSWQKIVYFAIGAGITYFLNILRIATIFIIAVANGVFSEEVMQFHNYYGQLYSISWIISYPLIIVGSRLLWTRIRNTRNLNKEALKPLQVNKPF